MWTTRPRLRSRGAARRRGCERRDTCARQPARHRYPAAVSDSGACAAAMVGCHASALLTDVSARRSWVVARAVLLALSTGVAGQQGGEGDSCVDHAGCSAGLYCTRAKECGVCRDDDDEQLCQLWADSVDGSCETCGDNGLQPDIGLTPNSVASETAPHTATDSGSGRERQLSGRKAGRRKRKPAAQKRAAAGDSRVDAQAIAAVPNFVAIADAFTTQELSRLRHEAASIPVVHSNAGVQGKRNIGTKESEIQGLSRERFGWVYDRMRKLVYETNAAHW